MQQSARFAAAFILAAASMASAAQAAPRSIVPAKVPTAFSRCDGYGAPSGSGDGMTAQAMTLLIFVPGPKAGDTTRAATAVGAEGIAACDQALGELQAKYWQRKVSLLRARAMHQLGDGDTAGALLGLDRAEAAVEDKADPYYQRSLGLGASYIRAYALREAGETAKAEALAMETWRQRPYNRQSAISALIAIGADGDKARREALTRGLAQLAPGAGDDLYRKIFDEGRFAEAIALFPSLIPPAKLGDEPMTPDVRAWLAHENRNTGAVYLAFRGGQTAYALAAVRKTAEARAQIAAAKQRLMEATDPPPEPRPDDPAWKTALFPRMLEANEQALIEGTRYADEWGRLVERRINVAEGRAQSVLDGLVADPVPRGRAGAELIDALMAKLPAGSPDLAALKSLRAELEPKPEDRPVEGLGDLFESLPDAETRQRMSRYDRQGLFSGDSFSTSVNKTTGVTTVTFFGYDASPAICEEMALLRAADLALKAGKPGLIIVGRKDFKHTTSNVSYGTVMATYHSGFDTRLDLVFVIRPPCRRGLRRPAGGSSTPPRCARP